MNISKKIVSDKKKGLSDKEIGEKYGISLRIIEEAITSELGVNVSFPNYKKQIKSLIPKKFVLENTSVWSFKSRGNWATHNGNYRGNWSPYIPRNIIMRYSKENDLVLDYFCGAGTTGVECKLLNRDFIGVDINPHAIQLAKENSNFFSENLFEDFDSNIEYKIGDARDLSFLNDDSIDLICAHPPYADIVHYTDKNPNDLSYCSIGEFLEEISKVAEESYRVLKTGKQCVILIGDMRKNKHIVPLGFKTIEKFRETGFILEEIIIKRQHNCKTTGFWYNNSMKFNFLLMAHEYLVVFQKPGTQSKNNTQPPPKSNYYNFRSLKNNFKEDIQLESTSVWVFDEKEWLNNVLINLTKRYSNKNFLLYNVDKPSNDIYDLIIKYSTDTLHKCLSFASHHLVKDGIFAIICEDVRLEDGTIYPLAISVNSIFNKFKGFKIKEIVVVSIEDGEKRECGNKLMISHKYVLIFRKV